MLATPLGIADLVLGHLGYLLIRVVVASAAFLLVGALLGAFASWWALLAGLVAVLCGLAHAAPVMAFSGRLQNEAGYNLLFRFVVIPMFLFAGTFFPVDQLPAAVRPLAWVTPLWHGTAAARDLALARPDWLAVAGHVAYLLVWLVAGLWLAVRSFRWRLIE
jgi:lipooligosaccharide transport system permease protein